MINHPAIGRAINAGGIRTNYLEMGNGDPIVLLHGSGMGVAAHENWSSVIPDLAREFRVIAPDIVGFGFTDRPEGFEYSIKNWVRHITDFLDALELERPILVGNSFGGSVALAIAMRASERLSGLVLMGTPAGDFTRTGRGTSWYYEPSLDSMRELLLQFPYDPSIVTDEMVVSRHEISQLAGGLEAYRKLFPEPGREGEQRVIRGMPPEKFNTISVPALVLHGREDEMVPLECGIRIATAIADAELHVFGKCGHWVQVERAEAFIGMVKSFSRHVFV